MPDNNPELPNTASRLSTSITLRLLPSDINPKNLSVAQIQQAVVLGAVTEFSEENSRPTEIRYELDADVPGEIVEQLPQLPTRSLKLQRAVLYESDMLEAFGISGGDLINQSKAFAIMKVEKAPTGALDSKGAAVPTRITLYSGCWFTSNPKAYKVSGGSIRILQDVDVAYARRRVVLA